MDNAKLITAVVLIVIGNYFSSNIANQTTTVRNDVRLDQTIDRLDKLEPRVERTEKGITQISIRIENMDRSQERRSNEILEYLKEFAPVVSRTDKHFDRKGE